MTISNYRQISAVKTVGLHRNGFFAILRKLPEGRREAYENSRDYQADSPLERSVRLNGFQGDKQTSPLSAATRADSAGKLPEGTLTAARN